MKKTGKIRLVFIGTEAHGKFLCAFGNAERMDIAVLIKPLFQKVFDFFI